MGARASVKSMLFSTKIRSRSTVVLHDVALSPSRAGMSGVGTSKFRRVFQIRKVGAGSISTAGGYAMTSSLFTLRLPSDNSGEGGSQKRGLTANDGYKS